MGQDFTYSLTSGFGRNNADQVLGPLSLGHVTMLNSLYFSHFKEQI